MSVITPNETALNWKAAKREHAVHLVLSGAEGDAAELATTRVAGCPVHLSILPTSDWINPEELAGAAAAVIQVDADSAASMKRFQKLATSTETPLIAQLNKRSDAAAVANAKLVSIIKSVGGVGATALVSQLAIRFAEHEAAMRREACLIDLDVQFGDVAFQLGLRPKLSLADLLEAGARLDGDLLRATTSEHSSRLKV